MKIKVIRQETVANTRINYKFDVKGYKFLVKNLTDDDILVALDENATEDEMVLIPSECSQIVQVYEHLSIQNASDTVSILPKATSDKGVEVQCLLW